jgi:hypothetical protein
VYPAGVKLTPRFFEERTVPSNRKEMRAFASEVVLASAVLNLFITLVAGPVSACADHIAGFRYLAAMIEILKTGEDVVPRVLELKRLVRLHHAEFQRLYPLCMKPKVHYLKHCIDCMQRFRINLSCFGPERKHKDMCDLV